MKKNVALLAGGYSGENVISVKTAATIEKHIDAAKYNVYKIIINRDEWIYKSADESVAVDKNDFSICLDSGKITFDVVFIAIHGTPGEDGKLQGYFDMLKLPYTSSGMISSALTFNKSYCNKVVAAFNLVNVAKSVHLFRENSYDAKTILGQLKLPVFVKPNEGGSSIGMSKVTEAAELEEAIEKAFKEDSQVLVEEFVKGTEVTCGVYKAGGKITVLPLTQVSSKEGKFFDFESKYTAGKAIELTPAPIDEASEAGIRTAAPQLYEALNCRGVVRIDFILEENTGNLFFLEVNTMPGQSETSIVPQQVRAAGMNLDSFYDILLTEALNR